MAAVSSWLAATAIGVGVAGAANSAKASKKAGQVQAQASREAIDLQREQYANAFKVLSRYGVQGDWANNQIAALMRAPQMAPRNDNVPPMGAGAGAGMSGPDYAGYVRMHPDIAQEWSKPAVQQRFGGDMAAYGAWHVEKYGQFEDREIPQYGQPAAPPAAQPQPGEEGYKTPDQLQEEAYANYKTTPWAKIARENADRATEDFTSMAGAQGSALSGRTARGMAEVRDDMEQRGFGDYFSVLGGMADRGFQADSGIASGGQTFANNAGALLQDAAAAEGAGLVGSANAWNSAISDAAGWAGWVAGQHQGGNVNPNRIVGGNNKTGGAPRGTSSFSAFKSARPARVA